MKNKYLTVKEAAEILRVSYRTLQRYLYSGKIPYTKPAGRVLVNEQDIINFINMVR